MILLISILLGALGGVSSGAAPKYVPLRLHEMILIADLVVDGVIVDVSEETFTAEVQQVVLGKDPGRRIEVRRFKNWTCASRWADYAADQRVLLFLADDHMGPPFRILSGGGEGEMPILRSSSLEAVAKPGDPILIEDHVVCRCFLMRDRAMTQVEAHGGVIAGIPLRLADLIDAIRRYRQLFRFDRDWDWNQRCYIVPAAPPDDAEAFAKTGPIASDLVQTTRSSRAYREPRSIPHWDSSRGAGQCRSIAFLGDLGADGGEDLLLGSDSLELLTMDARGTTTTRRLEFGDTPGKLETISSLALLGGIDSDANLDVALGLPEAFENRGAVRVLSLTGTGEVVRTSVIPSPLVKSGETGAGFGHALASLGDVDGDGIADLAVAQDPRKEPGVWLSFLNGEGALESVRRISIGESRGWFGAALAGLGDIDLDGIPELAVSAPDGRQGGEVWILFLDRDGNVRSSQAFGRDWDWSMGRGGEIGSALAGLGDVDGDGIPDLAHGRGFEGSISIISLNRDGTPRRVRLIGDCEGGFMEILPPDARFGSMLSALPERLGPNAGLCVSGASEEGVLRTWRLELGRDGLVRPR